MLTIQDDGKRNVIDIPSRSKRAMNGSIVIRGDGNTVRIESGCITTDGFRLELGSHSTVHFAGDSVLNDLFVYALRNAHLTVGRHAGFNGGTRILMHERGRVTIGDSALFAGQIDVSISDMHSIIDTETGRRINPPRDVVIGNRVWIGQRSMILKGAHIGDGTVVGAMSLVTKQLPSDSICCGVPAHVVRTGATWRHELLPIDQEITCDVAEFGSEKARTVRHIPGYRLLRGSVSRILPALGVIRNRA